jgi:hypothetical protein
LRYLGQLAELRWYRADQLRVRAHVQHLQLAHATQFSRYRAIELVILQK